MHAGYPLARTTEKPGHPWYSYLRFMKNLEISTLAASLKFRVNVTIKIEKSQEAKNKQSVWPITKDTESSEPIKTQSKYMEPAQHGAGENIR